MQAIAVENVNSISASGVSVAASRESPFAGDVSKLPPRNLIEDADTVGRISRGSPTPFLSRVSTPARSPYPNSPVVTNDGLPQSTRAVSMGSVPGVQGQEPKNVAQASNTQQRMQPKRGRDTVSVDEGAVNGGISKRRRLLTQDPVEKAVNASKKSSPSASTRHKKGHALSQTGTTPLSIPPPPVHPAWFLNCQKMFVELNLGKEWEALVSSWAAFEQRSRYTEVRRLGSAGRPGVVGQWINRGRRPSSWRPDIPCLKIYEAEFNAWWKSLQPTWRVVHGSVKTTLTKGNWECLRLPGQNGIVSVVAALFYWGLDVQGKVGPRKAWLTAVQDCRLVLSLV